MILIDNYDSFTYNIVQYLEELGIQPKIYENDKITIEDTAGISMQVINEFYKTKKILGICLGHQCIAQFFGGKVIKSQNPTHGKTSQISFKQKSKLFKDIPEGFNATRYHSLIVENLPECLKATAQTKDNIIMALEHSKLPIYGVQFHPEAILTEYGHKILENFINL